MRKAAGDSAKSGADGFNRKLQQISSDGGTEHGHNRSWYAARYRAAEQHDRNCGYSQDGCRWRQCWKRGRQRFYPQPEFSGDLGQVQAEKIFDLGAGDQDRDAIGETDHHRTRNKLHRRTHAGCAQHHEQYAGHHGAHEEAVDSVHCDNSRHHYDKCAGRPANLRFRSTQRGDKKAGHHGAVNSSLRSQA